MDYMTLKEAAEKWGVTPRRVNYFFFWGGVSRGFEGGGFFGLSQKMRKSRLTEGQNKERRLRHE